MTASTPLGFEYPIGTDPIASLDTILQTLCERMDAYVGLHASGLEVVNITALNTTITKAVAMPVDLFTATPQIFACVQSGSPNQFQAPTIANPLPESFDLKMYRTAGTTGNITVHWHAVQTNP